MHDPVEERLPPPRAARAAGLYFDQLDGDGARRTVVVVDQQTPVPLDRRGATLLPSQATRPAEPDRLAGPQTQPLDYGHRGAPCVRAWSRLIPFSQRS